jgi:hypothetical protein
MVQNFRSSSFLRGKKRAFFFLISSLNVKSLHKKIMLQNPGSSYSYFSNIFSLKNTLFFFLKIDHFASNSRWVLSVQNSKVIYIQHFVFCGGDSRLGRLLEYKNSDT